MQDRISLKNLNLSFFSTIRMGLKNHTSQNPLIDDLSLRSIMNRFRSHPMATGTFFLIDDDEDDREVFALALKEVSENAVCISCKNGKEALAQLSEPSLRPDHIFIDINMPLMSGKDCLREIRRLGHLKNVPVHMLTTATHVRDEQSYTAMGAQGIYTKPVRMVDLVSMLKNFYNNGTHSGEKFT